MPILKSDALKLKSDMLIKNQQTLIFTWDQMNPTDIKRQSLIKTPSVLPEPAIETETAKSQLPLSL
jgi:hypothetical protein